MVLPASPAPSAPVVPLLATARPPIDPAAWRRLLAVRLDNAGDVLMTGPALRALRDAAPGATMTLLTSPAGAAAAPLLPWIDEVWAERTPWQDLSGTLEARADLVTALVERLAAGRFDAALVFTSFSQSAWPPAFAAYLAGIPLRTGQARDFGGAILTHPVPPLPDEAHQVDRNAHLLEGLGIPVPDRRLLVALPSSARERADALLAIVGLDPRDPFLLVAPGASCDARRMPADRLVAAVRRIATERGWPVVVTGVEREALDAARLAAAVPGGVSLAGRTDLATLAALVERARLLVTAHSAPMHLADALGTPVVVAFSGTDLEEQWRPRATPAVLLRRSTPCAPCRRVTCPYGTPCLEIEPADLVAGAAIASASDRRPHEEGSWIATAS